MRSTLTTYALALGAALSLTGCKKASKPPAGEPAPTGAAADKAAAPSPAAPAKPKTQSLPALRAAVHTGVHMKVDATPAPEPPPAIFTRVHYKAPLGDNVAYVSPEVAGARRPAIVWIAGGFDWGISASDWADAPRENDQTAKAFREAGIVLMRPALRGSSGNPGQAECFLGEVDDILAAADYLATRPDVDPKRIYLGGHSTGGTLALLGAESTTRFRAVFAFGPVADPSQYGPDSCLPQAAAADEHRARSPIEFLAEIVTPTFVLDGARGNAAVFPMMKERTGPAPITYLSIPNADHFTALRPGSEVVAQAIVADTDTSAPPKLDISLAAIAQRLAVR